MSEEGYYYYMSRVSATENSRPLRITRSWIDGNKVRMAFVWRARKPDKRGWLETKYSES